MASFSVTCVQYPATSRSLILLLSLPGTSTYLSRSWEQPEIVLLCRQPPLQYGGCGKWGGGFWSLGKALPGKRNERKDNLFLISPKIIKRIILEM